MVLFSASRISEVSYEGSKTRFSLSTLGYETLGVNTKTFAPGCLCASE